MQYFIKNFALNKTYFVDKNVIKQIIKKVDKNFPDLKISDSEVIIGKSAQTFKINLDIYASSHQLFRKIIFKFVKEINSNIFNLFLQKPTNININYLGVS